MKELLLIERSVIEAIAHGAKKVLDISKELNMEFNLVLALLSRLRAKGIIELNEGGYYISKNELAWKRVNAEIPTEIKEISHNLVDCYFNDKAKNGLKLQKIYMSNKDEKIFKSLLNNIELFLDGLKKEKRRSPIKDQKVILWGYGQYDDLIQSSMNVS